MEGSSTNPSPKAAPHPIVRPLARSTGPRPLRPRDPIEVSSLLDDIILRFEDDRSAHEQTWLVTLNGLAELRGQIETLKNENKELRQRIEALEAR